MTRIASATLCALALSLALTTGCDEGGENPNFGAVAVDAGDCEGSSFDKDMDTGSTDPVSISAEASGRDVLLYLNNLDANCCPSPDAVVTLDGFDMLVEFDDETNVDESCDCMCVMDFTVTIEDLDPGTYTIEVDHDGAIIGDTEVEVEA